MSTDDDDEDDQMKAGRKSRRKTLLIGIIAARGNRITAGTNCHGCATHGRSGSVSAGVSSRAGSLAGFDDAEETERCVRARARATE